MKVRGKTQHEQHVDGEVMMTIKIDISGCLEVPPEDRMECIHAVTDSIKELESVAKILLCERNLKKHPRDEGADSLVSCRDLRSMENDGSRP